MDLHVHGIPIKSVTSSKEISDLVVPKTHFGGNRFCMEQRNFGPRGPHDPSLVLGLDHLHKGKKLHNGFTTI